MSIREDLAIRLIEERARLGYSQSDFARQLEMSAETLRRYEMGLSQVGAEFLAKAIGLGMDVQYVLSGIKSENLKKAEQASQPLVHIENGNQSGIVNAISGGVVNIGNQVNKVKAQVQPNHEHISDEQAFVLRRLVDEIVEMEEKVKQKPKSHKAIWYALNAHCRVPSYRLIPIDKYDKAEKYLRMWMGRLNSAKSAPKKDNNQWRNRRYAYIKINTKAMPEWLDNYLHKNFNADSLTELDDKQLDKVYRAVSSKKSRNKPKSSKQSGFIDMNFLFITTAILGVGAISLMHIARVFVLEISVLGALIFTLAGIIMLCLHLIFMGLICFYPQKRNVINE